MLLSCLVMVFLCQYVLAYTIDHLHCGPHGVNTIRESVEEALNIAQYAEWRMIRNDPRVNANLLQQVLGTGAKDHLIRRMGQVPAAIGQYTGDFRGTGANDPTVLITCGEGDIVYTRNAVPGDPQPDNARDTRFPNMWDAALRAGENVCGATVVASTYPTNTPLKPQFVILLCDGPPPHALSANRKFGANINNRWMGQQYDTFSNWMSSTLVHEFMHCLGQGIDNPLPSGRMETYDLASIKTLSDQDKEANAQGYSLLATGLYLRKNTMGESGAMGRRFSTNNAPGTGPHMYP
ncbi:hypothetical protein P154DRAFT_616255 [Amniculicola lignicola CBS 123094]|uniref:Lysine-specific metallo-endopeptidase domain-containing protein n=1 Tax=Amniculicola lignicola CBS 123094 TaxID=1392246 RepID=A0A6A5X2G8_9PLEO|nr:hypothetical protein P154DRAFT_616255 [Amniculicola lignicola CBS 123094]